MNNKYLEKIAFKLESTKDFLEQMRRVNSGIKLSKVQGSDILNWKNFSPPQALLNSKPLEKVSFTMPSYSEVKNTLNTAFGSGVRRIDAQIAKRESFKNVANIHQKGVNSVYKSDSDMGNAGAKRLLRQDTAIGKLKGKRDTAELDMHRARGTVAKGAAGVLGAGAVGVGIHSAFKNKSNEYKVQGY